MCPVLLFQYRETLCRLDSLFMLSSVCGVSQKSGWHSPEVGCCLKATRLVHSALDGGARAHATKNIRIIEIKLS